MSRKVILILLLLSSPTFAEQVTYQPGPFQGTDVWFGSVYNQAGVNDGKLQAGGWGDEYEFLIRFDVTGLPPNATQAIIWLAPYPKGDSSTLTDLRFYRVTSSWNESTGYFSKPSSLHVATYVAPTLGYWYGIDITNTYNAWKNNAYANWGLEYRPQSINNQFDLFRSSDYNTWSLRPYLDVRYTPTVTPPSFKSPLPGGKYWMVTTEIGGTDCANPGSLTTTHTGDNYFSIDFGRTSLQNGVTTVESNVPIYAAASGKVTFAGTNPAAPGNGNYVVIDHDGDGNEGTGYTTRYLHLQDNTLLVSTGQTVTQGQQLGVMGGTGGWPVHLHFGVRYANSGSTSVNELTWVKMEGINLKSYMTECNSSGSRIRFNYSSNTQ